MLKKQKCEILPFKNNIKKGENCICNTLLYCKGNVSLESEADEPKNIF